MLGILENLTSFIQLLSMLRNYGIPWPDSFNSLLEWTSTISANISALQEALPWIPVDWRTQFTIICTALPLFFTFAAAFFFKGAHVVGWYSLLLTGIAFVVLGTASIILKALNATGVAVGGMTLLIIGAVMVMLCIVLFCIYGAQVRHRQRRHTNMLDVMLESTEHIPWGSVVKKLVVAAALIAAGLIFSGWLDISTIDDLLLNVRSVVSLIRVLAIVGFVLGVIIFLVVCLYFSRRGRELLWKVRREVNTKFLKLLLVLVSLAYIPVVSTAIGGLTCQETRCAQGFRPRDDVTRAAVSIKSSAICESCNFTSECPNWLAGELCPAGVKAWRLYDNPLVDCHKIAPYFWPASGLTLLGFAICIPVLYYKMIKYVTRRLIHEFPLDTELVVPQSPAERWYLIVYQSQNVAWPMYKSFEQPWRYWRLLLLLQKLVVVILSLAVSRVAKFPALLVLTIFYIMFFVLVASSRPYISRPEVVVAAILAFILPINSLFALLLERNVINKESWKIPILILLILNVSTPVLALLLILLDMKSTKKVVKGKLEAMGITPAEPASLPPSGMYELSPAIPATPHTTPHNLSVLGSPGPLGSHPGMLVRPGAPMMALPPAAAAFWGADVIPRTWDESLVPAPLVLDAYSAAPPEMPLGSPDVAAETVAPDFTVAPAEPVFTEQNGEAYPREMGEYDQNVEQGEQWDQWPDQGDYHQQEHAEFQVEAVQDAAAYDEGWNAEWSNIDNGNIAYAYEPNETDAPELYMDAQAKSVVPSEAYLQSVSSRQQVLDFEINQHVSTLLTRFFLLSGLFSFIALIFSVLGILNHMYTVESNYTFASPYANTVDAQFSGYNTWSNFTGHCCCFNMSTAVEKWVCKNDHVVERMRTKKVDGQVVSGFPVRGMCSFNFTHGCGVSTSTGKPVLSCNNSISVSGITELW
eukprot:TRINITY_DN3986_c0_g1_i1.p1 TRINITY_DN3986_c0_g1~~TRINITY_DN3986_c0_g1_i1.p1  ORF type:complete len:925 (-),score=104.87 TRINITY_DN3986_c0_g1_i1:24-2798(-)